MKYDIYKIRHVKFDKSSQKPIVDMFTPRVSRQRLRAEFSTWCCDFLSRLESDDKEAELACSAAHSSRMPPIFKLSQREYSSRVVGRSFRDLFSSISSRFISTSDAVSFFTSPIVEMSLFNASTVDRVMNGARALVRDSTTRDSSNASAKSSGFSLGGFFFSKAYTQVRNIMLTI
jgi:hypothetical protein